METTNLELHLAEVKKKRKKKGKRKYYFTISTYIQHQFFLWTMIALVDLIAQNDYIVGCEELH